MGDEWVTKWGEIKEVVKGSASAHHHISCFLFFSQSLTADEPAVHQPARATEKEDIHYAEIDFTQRRPEPSSYSDVLYAQVVVSKTPNSSTQTADCQESVYAEVRKKWMYGLFLRHHISESKISMLFYLLLYNRSRCHITTVKGSKCSTIEKYTQSVFKYCDSERAIRNSVHTSNTAMVKKNTVRADVETQWAVPAQTCDRWPIRGTSGEEGL